jgi:hypothetical protein
MLGRLIIAPGTIRIENPSQPKQIAVIQLWKR